MKGSGRRRAQPLPGAILFYLLFGKDGYFGPKSSFGQGKAFPVRKDFAFG